MDKEQAQAIVVARQGLIDGYTRYLDGGGNPDVAMCRQKDIAFILERAIAQLDEVLKTSTSVVFE